MSTTTYISSRNLPCKYWLNASDGAAFDVTSISFSWASSYGDTPVTFSTSDFANLPTRDNNQVSINTGATLLTEAEITGLDSSYTILYLSRNPVVENTEVLIDASNTRISYTNDLLGIDYSRIPIEDNNNIPASYLLGQKPILALTHNTKSKKIEILQNDETVVTTNVLAYEKGIKLDDSIHTLNGPNINISHILLFSPALDNTDTVAILNSLIEETPELADNLIWDNITTSVWNNTTTILWEGIR